MEELRGRVKALQAEQKKRKAVSVIEQVWLETLIQSELPEMQGKVT